LTSAPRLFLSAGDTSGDQHAARLVRRLTELVPGLEVEGLGGVDLIEAGMKLHADLASHAIIGIRPVLRAIPQLLGLLRRVAGALDERRPDVVVLVDYPGLNLFVARLAHRRGIPVVYFVAPQLWAWAPWRVKRFARVVDEVHVIFPFEEAFFRAAGIEAHWVGHPLVDGLPTDPPHLAEITDRPRPVALFPGSRRREVRQHMSLLLGTARALKERHPDISFHTAHVAAVERDNMARAAQEAGVELLVHGDDVHGVMASCRCALVASGTATLETAMLGTPLVVFYRITPMENRLRKVLLVPPFIGQVNLVSGRAITPEILVTDEDPQPLLQAIEPLVTDTNSWCAQVEDIRVLREQCLGRGAVERAAELLARRLG
jgi:lipid-A-disaccharide synthase